ncbi:hypothetical protein QAD02_001343, partial [Eretmocerus hayati]
RGVNFSLNTWNSGGLFSRRSDKPNSDESSTNSQTGSCIGEIRELLQQYQAELLQSVDQMCRSQCSNNDGGYQQPGQPQLHFIDVLPNNGGYQHHPEQSQSPLTFPPLSNSIPGSHVQYGRQLNPEGDERPESRRSPKQVGNLT